MCLELVYEHVPIESDCINVPHNWLHKTCSNHSLDGKNMALIHKLLFDQRVRSRMGPFFDGVAIQAAEELGQITEV